MSPAARSLYLGLSYLTIAACGAAFAWFLAGWATSVLTVMLVAGFVGGLCSVGISVASERRLRLRGQRILARRDDEVQQ